MAVLGRKDTPRSSAKASPDHRATFHSEQAIAYGHQQVGGVRRERGRPPRISTCRCSDTGEHEVKPAKNQATATAASMCRRPLCRRFRILEAIDCRDPLAVGFCVCIHRGHPCKT